MDSSLLRTAQTVAALGSLSLMASGMPDALQALSKGPGVAAVDATRAVTLSCMLLDGIIGTVFARGLGDAMNLRLRVASVALTTAYLAVLLVTQGQRGLATTGKTVAKALAAAAAVLAALQFVEPERRQAVLGVISVATGWLFAASPLFTLRNMVRVRDASSISLPLALALTVTAMAWATYGAFIGSPWITWPNVVNAALALTQLVVRLAWPGPGLTTGAMTPRGSHRPKHSDVGQQSVVALASRESVAERRREMAARQAAAAGTPGASTSRHGGGARSV